MKKKYFPKLILILFLISGFLSIINLINLTLTKTKSEFWTIAACVSIVIATYLLFKLTECRVFLVLLSFDLVYFGNEILSAYGLEVEEIWKNIISVVEWILIILMVVVYLTERKILNKKIKDVFYSRYLKHYQATSDYDVTREIQLNKLTKFEILMIVVTILVLIVVITGLIEFVHFYTTREIRSNRLIILGILLLIMFIILRRYKETIYSRSEK